MTDEWTNWTNGQIFGHQESICSLSCILYTTLFLVRRRREREKRERAKKRERKRREREREREREERERESHIDGHRKKTKGTEGA